MERRGKLIHLKVLVETCDVVTSLVEKPAHILHVEIDAQQVSDSKFGMSSSSSHDGSETSANAALHTKKHDFSENREMLSLAYERLHSVPHEIQDEFGPHVKILDLSHNNISNFDFLTHFENLTSLIIDNNPVTETTVFPHLPNLQLLWLNHCNIVCLFPWLRRLRRSVPGLQYLCLMGNPAAPSYINGGTFYQYLQYRLFVISVFPALLHLDDRVVTLEQRNEAARLYPAPFLRRVLVQTQPLHWPWLQNKLDSLTQRPTDVTRKKSDRNLPI